MNVPRHPLPRHLLGAAACAVLLAGAVGCTTDTAPPPAPSPTGTSSPLTAVDPDREALEGLVAELEDTVTALRAELEAAAAGDQDALVAAAELLVADVGAVTGAAASGAGASGVAGDDQPEGETGGDGADPDPSDDADATPPTVDLDAPPPILPGPLASRAESIQYGDLLTRTLAAARGAGSAGEPVQRFLADPLAGDLGAWQRSPGDQLDAIADAGTTGDLQATQTAVLQLQGEASRALAWVVHGLTVPADAADAAERALAHLAIIDLSLDQLT